MIKESVQAIHPLNQSQLSFLIHHISATDDQGLLQLSFDIEGHLDLEKLNQALNDTIDRHEAMRATVHWEKIKKPVIVIHKKHEQNFELIQADGNRSDQLNAIRQEQKDKGIDFKQKGLSRLALYRFSPTSYTCVWTCHHILLDGWSAVNLLNELFKRYHNSEDIQKHKFLTLPSIEEINSAVNLTKSETAKGYWKEHLNGFSRSKQLSIAEQERTFERIKATFSASELEKLKTRSKQLKTSLANLLQLGWGLTLCKLYNTKDVVYGVVSSGRNLPLKGIEEVAYLLTNTLPFRFKLDESNLEEMLKQLDAQKLKSIDRESDHLADIEKWVDWQDNSALIESVFAYANFQWKDIVAEGIVVKNLLGDFTSTYPLTLLLFEDRELTVMLDFDKNTLSLSGANTLLEFYKNTVIGLTDINFNLTDLKSKDQQFELAQRPVFTSETTVEITYQEPTTPTEILINKIWQEVLGVIAIGINHNFFKLGGKSVQALRICVAIEKELGTYFNPTYLLLNPTIKKLAKVIDESNAGKTEHKPTCLVPLKATGTKAPLFCLHAGEGNILFYRELAENISKDIPLYAVQPQPLEATGKLPDTIPAMAKQYYEEIKLLTHNSPLYVLGTCFSNPICLEIAELALADNLELGAIFIVDSGPVVYAGPKAYPPISGGDKMMNYYKKIERLIKEGDFDELAKTPKKILGKLFNGKPKKRSSREIKRELNNTLDGYIYKTHNFGIELIHSSQYKDSFIVKGWNKVVKEVEISVVENSRHLDIFKLPEVERLAEILTYKMNSKQNESLFP